ncbi:MAG: C4-type zinc ribbon domain-containing protein [bacterium]
MKPEEIQALLDLQELDLKLLEYERHQKQLPGLIEEIERPVREAQDAKDRLDAELTMARSQHKTVELELASNNQQFKKLQTQQMAVRNQIEYEAFQHEMESLKERQDSLEEAGIKWIERETDANGKLPELEQVLGAATDVAGKARAELDDKTAELKRIHDEASQLQAPLLKAVPAQVLGYYKRLRKAGKAPFVAIVSRGACGGCGHRHPPQRLQEIKKNSRLIPCEQCGRIQVWREQEEEQIGF